MVVILVQKFGQPFQRFLELWCMLSDTDTTIMIRWTVVNSGLGITATSTWRDRMFFSTDNQTSESNCLMSVTDHSELKFSLYGS